MNLTINPGSPLQGDASFCIPGDKSISHRASLIAAMANGESHIENFQVSGVTQPMLAALTSLGIVWGLDGVVLTVQGKGLKGLRSPVTPIHCGNSATTLRLLAGALAAAGISAELDGSPGLRLRPMDRIIDPLRQMNVQIESASGKRAPIRLHERPSGSALRPLQYSLPVASAQVKSCLLLASLGAEGASTLIEPGPSRDHTERLLSSLGVQISSYKREKRYVVTLTPPQPSELMPMNMVIPGDPSAAAFMIVAALITQGSNLFFRRICLNPTRTGLLEALKSMGALITIENVHLVGCEPIGDLAVEFGSLHGTHVSGELVVRMIDEFPIFAVAAAKAEGTTIVREAPELRLKESDRIGTLTEELRKLGATIQDRKDGFIIQGGRLHGGVVDSHGDHRLAMALVVAGLASDATTTIQNAECFTESFPLFVHGMVELGVQLAIEE